MNLAELLTWVTALPAVFSDPPEGLPGGTVRVRAVVADLFSALFDWVPGPAFLAAFQATGPSASEANRLGWVLAACHLLWHPELRTAPLPRSRIEALLVQEMATLAAVVPVAQLTRDAARAEELVRRVLRAAGLRLDGESAEHMEDQLRQVDSVERQRVLWEAEQRHERAQQVRDAMAKKAAQEAAAKVSRE